MDKEYKAYALREIDAAILTEKNRLLNLVDKAYAEGKKAAEVNRVAEIIGDALQLFYYDGVFCCECKWFDPDGGVGETGFCHNPRFGDGYANYSPPCVCGEFHCADGDRMDGGADG